MIKRKKIINIFSTFIQFEYNKFRSWLTDYKLKKSMVNCLAKNNDEHDKKDSLRAKEFWALFWYCQWKNATNSLARNHLLAYLQESCYWASQKTLVRFDNSQYQLSDLFNMAIADTDKILAKYKIEYGVSLSTYAEREFVIILNRILREKSKIEVCTDWALLRRISKKKLEYSLKNAGFSLATINNYYLLWICFKELYTPQQKKVLQQLPPPDKKTLEAMIYAYRKEVIKYPELTEINNLNAETLFKILKKMAIFIRQNSYFNHNFISLNIKCNKSKTKELIDTIENFSSSPIEEIINQENIDFSQKVNKILTEELEQLDSEIKLILELYYKGNVSQQEIAQKLSEKLGINIHRTNVYRRIKRGKNRLLEALIKWSKRELDTTIDTEKIKEMTVILEDWIYNSYNQ